jgi:hypothetical protein
MPILVAIFGAVMTGVMYWVIFGNGREVINAWLDERNEKAKLERDAESAMRARALEARAPLKALNDPRDAAVALMVAIAEARGEMTPEQAEVIRARMQNVLDIVKDVDDRLAVAKHAARRAGSPEVVMDEGLPFFREALTESEQDDLLAMLNAVAAVHAGPTDRQAQLIARLENRFLAERRPGKA